MTTKTKSTSAPTAEGPAHVHTLSRAEIDAILARNHVGRLAYFYEGIDIEPIHYVFADGVLCARTSRGEKLIKMLHNQGVAFEVDEVRGLFDWCSVVVKGSVYPVEEGRSAAGDTEYAQTLARLRELVPEALREDDQAPHRTILFRIHIGEVTGRRCEPGKASVRVAKHGG